VVIALPSLMKKYLKSTQISQAWQGLFTVYRQLDLKLKWV